MNKAAFLLFLASSLPTPATSFLACNHDSASRSRTLRHLSDVEADAPEAEIISSDSTQTAQIENNHLPDVKAMQNSILRIAAATDRGQYAKLSQKDNVSKTVMDLESNMGELYLESESETIIPAHLAGTWELLYSNVQLFRSSPFFLAGRSTCRTEDEIQQFQWFCDMHRAALAISNIGMVRQVITSDGKLVNEFEVKAGSVPFLSDFLPGLKYSGGLPITIDGAIVSTADATPVLSEQGGIEWNLLMDTVEIKGSNLPLLQSILNSDNAKLRTRDLSKLLEENIDSYQTPQVVLRTTFVDSDMRIARDVDDNIFVYGRVSDSEECTDYSGVLPDLGVASLLEGFNDAIAKLYL